MVRHSTIVRRTSRRPVGIHDVIDPFGQPTREPTVCRCDSCGHIVVRGMGRWWLGREWRQ